MIFETHAHYDDAKFDTDREMLLAELPQRGISPVINAGSSIATTKTTLSLAQEYPFLYAAVGVHPSDVDDLNEDTYAWLRQQTTLQKTVAVGEIGLDYYWDKEPEVLQRLLKEIFDENEPFTQTEDTKKCAYCDFKAICKR